MRSSRRHPGYIAVGALYVLLSVPAWISLVSGRLLEGRNFYLLASLLGAPLGAFFAAFGFGGLIPNRHSRMGFRLSLLALFFVAVTLVSWMIARSGVTPLMTSVLFSAMAASYLSLVSLVFLLLAVFKRPPTTHEKT